MDLVAKLTLIVLLMTCRYSRWLSCRNALFILFFCYQGCDFKIFTKILAILILEPQDAVSPDQINQKMKNVAACVVQTADIKVSVCLQ
jgi:hypothetical protein